MYIRLSSPHSFKNTTTLFLAKPPLPQIKSANCQSPPFEAIALSILVFREPPPPKNWILQWIPKILKFFTLNPSNLLKVTKFLVKISQFEFFVMTEKNIFVYQLFLSLNISDFSLFFM